MASFLTIDRAFDRKTWGGFDGINGITKLTKEGTLQKDKHPRTTLQISGDDESAGSSEDARCPSFRKFR
jgi:hypothetical protein